MAERRSVGVIRRVLEEMDRQHISYVQLAARLGPGWTNDYLALRLGELMPLRPGQTKLGGRIPLTGTEIEQLAEAFKISPAQITLEQLEPAA